MRLTKKKAIDISIELWEWLAETGETRKKDWNGWNKYGYMWAYCALCKYARQRGGACGYCPYYEVFGLCGDTNPYGRWLYAETPKTRKKYALKFLEQLRSL